MTDAQFGALRDDQLIEVDGKIMTVGKVRADNAAREPIQQAKLAPKRAEFRSHASAEFRRLRAASDADHQKRLDQSKQLVAGEIAKWKASPGGVGDPHKPSPDSLESRAAALKLREASAKTAADWLALEADAKALLAQAQ